MAVHGLAVLFGRNDAGISNRGKIFCTTLYDKPILINDHQIIIYRAKQNEYVDDFGETGSIFSNGVCKTRLATAVTNVTKPVTKINSGPNK